ncbi:MAG: CrcB family protein [Chitinophagaceae bacterium]|nr:CrcB family protein [Chitinophagaceae bacterium]
MIKNILLVGLGGGLGSMLRYACWLLIPARQFPYATLTVNSIGSFVIGLVLAYSLRETGFSDHWKIFLTTGVCGASPPSARSPRRTCSCCKPVNIPWPLFISWSA